jgi:hypothetical protein
MVQVAGHKPQDTGCRIETRRGEKEKGNKKRKSRSGKEQKMVSRRDPQNALRVGFANSASDALFTIFVIRYPVYGFLTFNL